MKLSGACNLNRKSSPGRNALNGAAPGAQKLTSESSEFVRRWLNHSASVTAITSRTTIVNAPNLDRRSTCNALNLASLGTKKIGSGGRKRGRGIAPEAPLHKKDA